MQSNGTGTSAVASSHSANLKATKEERIRLLDRGPGGYSIQLIQYTLFYLDLEQQQNRIRTATPR